MRAILHHFKAVLCLAVIMFFAQCKNDSPIVAPIVTTTTTNLVKDNSGDVIIQWQNLFLEVERYAAVYRPCPAARMLGYVGLAAYESTVPGMPEYQSLAARYGGLTIPAIDNTKVYDYPTILNAVYGSLYKKFFANVQATDILKITSLQSSLDVQYSSKLASDVFKRSRDYGTAVASAVWDYSVTDTYGHDSYLTPRPTSYTPPAGAGKWIPTPPGNQAAMFPYWGKVRVFAIQDADKLAKPPIPYSEDKNSQYYAQGLEVYSLTRPQSYEGQWIAEFWSDDVLGFTFSPPSRWIAISSQALLQSKSNLETAVITALKVGLALNDAAVACWNSKFYYNVQRPITYINKVIDPSYTILSNTSTGFLTSTPSFAAYPSGHATFGAAAAEALVSIFGAEYSLTDRCHENRSDFTGSKPRSFNSFYDMAVENAVSRIYLGVHWHMDADEGLRLGYQAGRRVNALPIKK